MMRKIQVVLLAALFACGLAGAAESSAEKKKSKAEKKAKVEGASCKAPAVGPCASCAITCRPGEAAMCAPGQISGDLCTIQPVCRCSAR